MTDAIDQDLSREYASGGLCREARLLGELPGRTWCDIEPGLERTCRSGKKHRDTGRLCWPKRYTKQGGHGWQTTEAAVRSDLTTSNMILDPVRGSY